MMTAKRALLCLLVGFGFFSSGRLAYREWTTGEACPVVGSVPACYVAFAGYLAMLVGLIAIAGRPRIRRLFYAGLFVAGGLALIGTVLELVKGNVCPRVSGIPMCYISLGMSVLIGVLFWRTTVDFACGSIGFPMKRTLVIVAGSLLLLLGTISMVSPIPGGVFMLSHSVRYC